jgi:hypothetical protein
MPAIPEGMPQGLEDLQKMMEQMNLGQDESDTDEE